MTIPMLLLRNCAKIFFLNELEACQLFLLIKQLGWKPDQTIMENLATFDPPRFLVQEQFMEKMVNLKPLFAHLMVLCFTAKTLLNDRHVTYIIQNFIELQCFPHFGEVFNCWIKKNSDYCRPDMKKINKLYASVTKESKTYAFADHDKQVPPKAAIEPQNNALLELEPQFSSRTSKGGTRKNSLSLSERDNYSDMESYPALSRRKS